MMESEKIAEIENISDEEVLSYFSNESLKMYIKSISVYPLLSAEEQKEAWAKGDRNTLINCNLRLVVKTAVYYARNLKQLSILDIIQEGNIGLMRAIDTYNPEKGAFSTYAIPWIRQKITRAKLDQDKSVRIPVHVSLLVGKYNRLLQDAFHKGIKLSDEEIMASLNISEGQYMALRWARDLRAASLNQPINEDEDVELGNIIPDENSSNFENIIDTIASDDLKKILRSILTPLQYYVLYNRYLAENCQTLEEVGKSFYVTRERIRQVEVKALEKAKSCLIPNSEVYKEAYKALIKGGSFAKYKTLPLSPYDIVKYFYLKDDLLPLEREMYKLIFLGDYNYTLMDIASKLNLSLKDTQKICSNLTNKINAKFRDVQAYNEYKRDLLLEWKAKIYDKYFIEQRYPEDRPIIKDYLERKYAHLPLETILAYFQDINYALSDEDMVLLQKFFSCPHDTLRQEKIEQELNQVYHLLNILDIQIQRMEIYRRIHIKI